MKNSEEINIYMAVIAAIISDICFLYRRQKMSEILKLMGIDHKLWRATDGKLLENEEFAADVVLLPGYEDPYYKRPMKTGEVGHSSGFSLKSLKTSFFQRATIKFSRII